MPRTGCGILPFFLLFGHLPFSPYPTPPRPKGHFLISPFFSRAALLFTPRTFMTKVALLFTAPPLADGTARLLPSTKISLSLLLFFFRAFCLLALLPPPFFPLLPPRTFWWFLVFFTQCFFSRPLPVFPRSLLPLSGPELIYHCVEVVLETLLRLSPVQCAFSGRCLPYFSVSDSSPQPLAVTASDRPPPPPSMGSMIVFFFSFFFFSPPPYSLPFIPDMSNGVQGIPFLRS